ncbi:hypothetical protein EDD16DRAFT_1528730 [Pisolithus croceorrhizus]|nr:hypothetical protein EDD16DRAFT_1528730 [Pisolithus croceorrhizus]
MAVSTNSKSNLGEPSAPELTSLDDHTRASASASRSLCVATGTGTKGRSVVYVEILPRLVSLRVRARDRRLEGEREDEFGEDDSHGYARRNADSERQEAGIVPCMQFGGAPSLEAAYLRAQPNQPTQPMETNMIPDASPSLPPLAAVGPDRRMTRKVEKNDAERLLLYHTQDPAVVSEIVLAVQLERLRVTEALATVMDVEKTSTRPYCVVITLLGRYIELRRPLLRGVQHLSYFQHTRLADSPIKSLKRMYETTVFLGAEIPDVLLTMASDPYFRNSQWKLRPPLTGRVESQNTQHHYNQYPKQAQASAGCSRCHHTRDTPRSWWLTCQRGIRIPEPNMVVFKLGIRRRAKLRGKVAKKDKDVQDMNAGVGSEPEPGFKPAAPVDVGITIDMHM